MFLVERDGYFRCYELKVTQESIQKRQRGPIAFFVAIFIVALGAIQLASTFHTYALNMAELNGLKKQEAALIAQKQELENDIARWDDKATLRRRRGIVWDSCFRENRRFVWNIPKR